ncbi:MAG: crossover junction endodeoxyribonuclease RuvC [Candidatus Moranbacteria bacterium]|nr:crossover junction endodeoxyribonuclease RuvC [Candidatus Moranbacteria bacterium]
MIILGIDPGFARIGYGVLKKHKGHKLEVLEYGSIVTYPKIPFADRLVQISGDIQELIQKYQPDHYAIEDLYYFKNKKTIISVGAARGVLLLMPRQHKVPVFEYTPLQVKQAVTGYGKAEKSQVMAMVKSILNIHSGIKLDDTSDALAVCICHASTVNHNKLLRNI